MRDVTALRDRFLEWLYEQTEGRTTQIVSADEFFTGEGLDTGEGMGMTRRWAIQGLIDEQNTMGNSAANLTTEGIEHVLGRRRRRSDPALRRPAARNGLLRWLYEQDPDGESWTYVEGFASSDHSLFEGDRFTDGEIDRAAEFLKDKRLIDGPTVDEFRGPVAAQLTSEGQDCIEDGGDVADYLRDQKPTGTTINTHIGTIHNAGAMAIGSTDITQNVTANVDPAAMAAFAQMLQKELPNLQLGTDREAAASTALAEVQREVTQANPDGGHVTQAFGRFVGYVSDAGKPIVTALLMLIAQHYGMPPQQ